MGRTELKDKYPLLGPVIEAALFEAERRIGHLGEMDLRAIRKELDSLRPFDVGTLFKGELEQRVIWDLAEYDDVQP